MRDITSVHSLQPGDFWIAECPTFRHTDWMTYDQIIPEFAMCITIGRLSANSVEFFVGDGKHTYADLPKSGTSGGGGTTDYSGLSNKPKINGAELFGNKAAEQFGLANNDAKQKGEFVAEWGDICLLDNPWADWSAWLAWAQAKVTAEGMQKFRVPYGGKLMVDVFVDTAAGATYPIVWQMKSNFYGKNASGISALGGSTADSVLKSELSAIVINMLYNDVTECGTF